MILGLALLAQQSWKDAALWMGGIVLFPLVAWGVKRWFERELDKRVLEHGVRFTKLHEARFGAVNDVWAALAKADRAILLPGDVQWRGPEQHRENLEKFHVAAEVFRETFNRSRIYFAPDVAERLEAYWTAMKRAAVATAGRGAKDDEPWWFDRYCKAGEEMRRLKGDIENDCRRLLGALEQEQVGRRTGNGAEG